MPSPTVSPPETRGPGGAEDGEVPDPPRRGPLSVQGVARGLPGSGSPPDSGAARLSADGILTFSRRRALVLPTGSSHLHMGLARGVRRAHECREDRKRTGQSAGERRRRRVPAPANPLSDRRFSQRRAARHGRPSALLPAAPPSPSRLGARPVAPVLAGRGTRSVWLSCWGFWALPAELPHAQALWDPRHRVGAAPARRQSRPFAFYARPWGERGMHSPRHEGLPGSGRRVSPRVRMPR